jgi:hypothetical protein
LQWPGTRRTRARRRNNPETRRRGNDSQGEGWRTERGPGAGSGRHTVTQATSNSHGAGRHTVTSTLTSSHGAGRRTVTSTVTSSHGAGRCTVTRSHGMPASHAVTLRGTQWEARALTRITASSRNLNPPTQLPSVRTDSESSRGTRRGACAARLPSESAASRRVRAGPCDSDWPGRAEQDLLRGVPAERSASTGACAES